MSERPPPGGRLPESSRACGMPLPKTSLPPSEARLDSIDSMILSASGALGAPRASLV